MAFLATREDGIFLAIKESAEYVLGMQFQPRPAVEFAKSSGPSSYQANVECAHNADKGTYCDSCVVYRTSSPALQKQFDTLRRKVAIKLCALCVQNYGTIGRALMPRFFTTLRHICRDKILYAG